MIALVADDTLPTPLTYRTAKGAVIDISSYSFTLRIGYTQVLAKVAAVADGPNGVLQFNWAPGDLVEGTWPIEITAINAAGKEKTHKLGTLVIAGRL